MSICHPINLDISYFSSSYKKADYVVDLDGLDIADSVEKLGSFLVNQQILPSLSPSCSKYTKKQGQYLAFIYYYTKIHRQPPSEADIQKYFRTTPASVHQMILALEKKGFISREPRKPRTIKILLSREELPDLE